MGKGQGRLNREVGVGGAVLLGLGSILGTGVFVSIGLGVELAGGAGVGAIALAAALAMCNGMSSAQLAAAFPVSGGTYEYGYRTLSPAAGFAAGLMFLLAKSASAATAALGFAAYLLRAWGVEAGPWSRAGLALGAVAALTVLVIGGLRRSTRANALMVGFVVATLAAFIAAGVWATIVEAKGAGPSAAPRGPAVGWGAFFHASALMFVAYTGYGRIATLGEEVRRPARTIPTAIIATVLVSAALYVGVGWVLASSWPAVERGAGAGGGSAPLEAAAGRWLGPGSWLVGLVAAGAFVAMLGVLLNLLLGLSRVLLAMGRRGDAPKVFGRVNAAGTTPTPAVLAVALLIGGLACVGDVRLTWTFSAFTVLVYYALTNAAALRLAPERRRYPRGVSWAGLVGCIALACFVPRGVWAAGLAMLGVGLVGHWAARRLRRHAGDRAG